MRVIPAMVLLLGLAACATPKEQCLNAATRDLRTVNGLIEQTQGNISRGYAIETQTQWVTDFDWCGGPFWGGPSAWGGYYGGPMMCERDRAITRQVPRTIDVSAEKKKLDDLLRKRAELVTRTGKQVEACRASYPE